MLLYFAEREVNPGFASVPHAMWWAVVTLTTLGYGDVVPVTVVGKLLGSVVAVLGLCMFALPASILASGFSEEMKRQNFVSTWHLVAKVPFFARLQATEIAEIASLLKLYRAVRGEVLMREGDTGECMYFIVSGQVEVRGKAGVFVLKTGDFFGEIALIERCPRTATVKAIGRCQLLILDARDFHKFVAHDHALLETIWETARQRMAQAEGHVTEPRPKVDA
jgi:voltage-gated potassium channel